MQNDSDNRGGFIALLFSIVLSLGFFVYFVFMRPGAPSPHAKESVSPTEQTVEKPWVDSPDLVTRGAKVFATNCQVCHGSKGLGDGPGGIGLHPPPRNFVTGDWRYGGDSASLFKVIATGVPGTSMPSFAYLPAVDRWAAVQFIRSITRNRTQDDPAKVEAAAKLIK